MKTYFETDYSDFDKIQIILNEGGIYLDLDVMVTQSFDELRRYNCTLGLERPSKICSGVIICTKQHPFLYLWLNGFYEDFRGDWAYNSGHVPTRLINRYRGIIHVDKNTLHRPNVHEMQKIWGKEKFNWRGNYAVHTWIRMAMGRYIQAPPTPETIKTMNSTYGEMARDVFYGSSDLLMT